MLPKKGKAYAFQKNGSFALNTCISYAAKLLSYKLKFKTIALTYSK